MKIHLRPYNNRTDLAHMISLVKTIRLTVGDSRSYLHAGDVQWRFFRHKLCGTEDPTKTILLAEDEQNTLVGYGWYSQGDVDLILHPDIPPDEQKEVIIEMLMWAEKLAQSENTKPVAIAFDDDIPLVHTLLHKGYTKGEAWLIMAKELISHEVILPKGFTAQSIQTTEDYQKLFTLRQATGAKNIAPDDFTKHLEIPDYHSNLHTVIVAPDGSFVAYALGWIDDVSQVALLEPVGTHPDYRRKGLGKAVLTACMNTLLSYSMKRVIVVPEESNTGAVALYRSMGCSVLERIYTWQVL